MGGAKGTAAWLVQAALFFGLWLVLVGKWSPHEAELGALAAALGATASHAVYGARLASPWVDWRSWLQAARLVVGAVCGTVEILAVLWRQLVQRRRAPSLLLAVPFDVGGDDQAERRALAVALSTTSPDVIVLGIDHDRGLLLYHRMAEGSVPPIMRALGARA